MIADDVDLFDFLPEIAAARQVERLQPLRDALTCLRDAVPEALEVVVLLGYRHEKDTRAARASGPWAYCVSRDGLRHEPRDEWSNPTDGGPRGWSRTPAHLTTWEELAALVGADPRRADLVAWAEGLTAPDRWRDLFRPHELWPNPEQWHPGYIEGDHERPGWGERITAWRTLQSILTTALETTT